MAKQTINIGASPNDGTGTPLRTAFDYTNQNFTELYTATGPSGNNIVVPGNATITGDLTVRTNKLVVNATGVGAGKTPSYPLDVAGNVSMTGAGTGSRFLALLDETNTYAGSLTLQAGGGSAAYGGAIVLYGNNHATYPGSVWIGKSDGAAGPIIFGNGGAAGGQLVNYRITGGTGAGSGIHTWEYVGGVAGTAMTLNATGLGVGTATHSVKLGVVDAGNTFAATFRGNGGTDFVAIGTTGFGASINAFTAGFGAATNLVLNPNGGNVGIGVTPNTGWQSSWKALDIGLIGGVSYGFGETNITSNVYRINTGAARYKAAGSAATSYTQVSGTHVFSTAGVAANAGDTITFNPAMTLDASGNLLVAKTASGFTVAGAEIRSNGEVLQTIAASTDATYVSKVYSSTAAAYRFYVGLGGTVFATNTTISAISDARLKENVQDIDVGLGAILALKPRKFDWKEGKGKNIKGDRGFIAQEFEQVFPQLVDKWADESPEGEAPYKSVRQDLIPVLVKAIQELTARVQTLETR